MTRLTDDELTALLAAHGGQIGGACWHQDHETLPAWPCETWRLATEVRDLRAVKDAAQLVLVLLNACAALDARPDIAYAAIQEHGPNFARKLSEVLARYEEGGP